MPLEPATAAKRAFIAYRQLSTIAKQKGLPAAIASVDNYNKILQTLRECFAVDEEFLNAINHL